MKQYFLIFMALLVLAPIQVGATITPSAATTNSDPNYANTSATFSHTVSGSRTALLVRVAYRNAGKTNTSIDSITYNGVALTKKSNTSSGGMNTDIWTLIAPASGANNVVVNFAEAMSYYIHVNTITDADQTTLVDGVNQTSGNGTAPSVAVTKTAANGLVFDVAMKDGTDAETVGADQTEEFNVTVSNTCFCFGSKEGPTTGTSVTMSWSWTPTSAVYSLSAANLKEQLTDPVVPTPPTPAVIVF